MELGSKNHLEQSEDYKTKLRQKKIGDQSSKQIMALFVILEIVKASACLLDVQDLRP